jgi:hypothetical protein
MQILKEEVLGQPLGLLEPNDLGSAGIDRLLEETVKEGVQMLPVDRNALSERLNNEDPQVIMMIGEEVVGYCAMTGVYKEKDGYAAFPPLLHNRSFLSFVNYIISFNKQSFFFSHL